MRLRHVCCRASFAWDFSASRALGCHEPCGKRPEGIPRDAEQCACAIDLLNKLMALHRYPSTPASSMLTCPLWAYSCSIPSPCCCTDMSQRRNIRLPVSCDTAVAKSHKWRAMSAYILLYDGSPKAFSKICTHPIGACGEGKTCWILRDPGWTVLTFLTFANLVDACVFGT